MIVKLTDSVLDATFDVLMCEFELSDLSCDLLMVLMLPGCPFLRVVINYGLLQCPVIILHCDDIGSASSTEGGCLKLFNLFEQESLKISEGGVGDGS